jgi:hypothetical protein
MFFNKIVYSSLLRATSTGTVLFARTHSLHHFLDASVVRCRLHSFVTLIAFSFLCAYCLLIERTELETMIYVTV